MFENFKQIIKTSAKEAVELAETAYKSGEGQLKKQAAIKYVASKIKLPTWLEFLKPILLKLLEQTLEEAIETAVLVLKQKLNTEAEV